VTQAVLEQECLELSAVRVIDLRRGHRDDNAPRQLAAALQHGLPVEPDPRRTDFYECSLHGSRYYFHVARRRPERVYLLAVRKFAEAKSMVTAPRA
jgi:hypothetical protein